MKLEDLFNSPRPSAKPVRTRFRAYKLGKAGSLCSYFAGDHFTLIEAMDSDISRHSLIQELKICGKEHIDTLHITSWDNDHCEANALEWILDTLKPAKIEAPGYLSDSQSAKTCNDLIAQYKAEHSHTANVIAVTPRHIASLTTAIPLGAAATLGYTNILYHPQKIYSKPNNNSTVKFFRTGAFNVLSTGDIEHHDIGTHLRKCKTLCRELDILILPHHGSAADLMTKELLEDLRPSLAVCTSNTANQYEHPDPAIRKLLNDLGIPLMTTKRGDVVIESRDSHVSKYKAFDLLSDGQTAQNELMFTARKFKLMSMNGDTIRDRLNHQNTGPRRQ